MSVSSMGFRPAASMSFRPAAWWASDRWREMRRLAAWGDRRHNFGELQWASDLQLRRASDRRRLWWASDRRLDEQAIGGLRWHEAIGSMRRSAVEEKFAWEREMREWPRRYSAKKRLGRWESDWERDWERWEMSKIILLTSRIKYSFFFFFALSYNAHLYMDVHCSRTSKFFPNASTAVACLLGMWS